MLKFADITRRGGSQTSPEDQGGFALATVLVLMMVLSTLSVFLLSSSGDAQRAGRAIRESARSFYAADAGVNAVVANWNSLQYDTLAPNPGDSADLGWTTLENGARYRAVLVRVDGGTVGDILYSVRVVGQGEGSLGGSTTIYREIVAAGIAMEGLGEGAVRGGYNGSSAYVYLGDKSSGTLVDGRDMVPSYWASEGICDPLEDGPALIWKDTTKINVGNSTVIEGTPDFVEEADMSEASLFDFGGLDYDDLVAMADITFSGDLQSGLSPVVSGGNCITTSNRNWGDPRNPSSPCFDYFPIIHATASVFEVTDEGGGYGQGILLIDGAWVLGDLDDVTFNFYGLIIQKGPGNGIDIEGKAGETANIYGAIISGGRFDISGASVQYSKCAIDRALGAHSLSTSADNPLSERVWRQVIN